MKNLNFSGQLTNKQNELDVFVNVFQFEEDGNTIIYCPAFDISGYGKTEVEAKESFQTVLAEFVTYTMNKNTFVKELRRLGWNVKGTLGKGTSFKIPGLSDLIQKNDYLQEILNEKQFTKFDHQVSIPC
jgi:hypothetical protein